jgi:hypothetical protein
MTSFPADLAEHKDRTRPLGFTIYLRKTSLSSNTRVHVLEKSYA